MAPTVSSLVAPALAEVGGAQSPFVLPAALVVGAFLLAPLRALFPVAHVANVTDSGSPLNQWFAKYAWFWTSLVFAVAVLRAPSWSRSRRLAAFLRYGLATAYWFLMTQWFWGAPLLDRVFLSTGGICQRIAESDTHDSPLADALAAGSMRVCRAMGGAWTGGHDVSGHCLLLVHSYLFLQYEFLAPRNPVHRHHHHHANHQHHQHHRTRHHSTDRLTKILIQALSLLWVTMLAITLLYYHTLPELLNGIVIGSLFAAVVYSPVTRS